MPLFMRKINAKPALLGILFSVLLTFSGLSQDNTPALIYLYPYPFDITVSLQAELRRPSAVELDMEGNTYIADLSGNRILKFDPNLQLLAATSGWGTSQDRFDAPTGLALDVGLNLFLCDYHNSRIVRLDRKLNFLADVSLPHLQSDYEYPQAITVSAWGDLYILEERTSSALKLQSSLDTVEQFGGFRPGNSATAGASAIAASDNGNIHIALPAENKAAAFDRYGNFLSQTDIPFPPLALACDGKYLWVAGDSFLYCLKDSQPVNINFNGESPRFQNIADLAAANGTLAVVCKQPPFLYLFRLSTSPASIQW